MPRTSEEISKYNSSSSGRTDANLANDSNHLGGIPADEYATQEYVQRYHNTKEAAQKEYIDEKDSTCLNSAKAYTDLMINSQDFSGFAQKTDVLALQQDTANKLAQCQTTCANNLETTKQQIVNDVNAGFDDVGQSINQLNANQQQLFTSVSNGKSKVAAAITDKGVSTASDASYDTMASNIRAIQTGGGELDPDFVNTGDATAKAEDIKLGETAYVKGNKVYGSHVCEDSSDANASAADILLGKSAYVNGEKVYGSLIPQSPVSQPTYGLDTTDATALTSDVRNGKTFYARGQKLTGTAYAGEVEEIYGTNIDQLTYDTLSGLGESDEIADVVITNRRLLKFSKDLSYCVCCSEINGTTYIESYAINDQGIYIQGSVGLSGDASYKKYRYSYSDLGLEENEHITDLELTKPGLFGSEHTCLLIIATIQTTLVEDGSQYNHKFKIHLYNYNLIENGVIGKLYESQSNVAEPYTEVLYEEFSGSLARDSFRVASFNLRNDKLFVVKGFHSYKLYDITIVNMQSRIFLNKTEYTTSDTSWIPSGGRLLLTLDDRFAYFESFSDIALLIYNDYSDNVNYTPRLSCAINSTCQIDLGSHISGTNKFISRNGKNIIMYEIGLGDGYIPRIENVKNLSSDAYGTSKSVFITSDKLIRLEYFAPGNEIKNIQLWIRVYDLQEILLAEQGDTVYAIDELLVASGADAYNTLNNARKFISDNSTKILSYTVGEQSSVKLNKILLEEDVTNIIGLQYNGNYYYRQDPHILTAGQPDVRSGKTFIGWMGMQETGTLEVE